MAHRGEWGRLADGNKGGRYKIGEAAEVAANTESGNTVLGLKRATWKDIHVYSSIVCVILVLIHVAMNWRWITNVTKTIF